MFKAILNFLNSSSKTAEEIYLENSTDLVDLERRQREISRGAAPFQKRYMVGY